MDMDLEELLELLESVFPKLELDSRPKQQRLALIFSEVQNAADFGCYIYQLNSDLNIIRFALERGVAQQEIKEALKVLHTPSAMAGDAAFREYKEKEGV